MGEGSFVFALNCFLPIGASNEKIWTHLSAGKGGASLEVGERKESLPPSPLRKTTESRKGGARIRRRYRPTAKPRLWKQPLVETGLEHI